MNRPNSFIGPFVFNLAVRFWVDALYNLKVLLDEATGVVDLLLSCEDEATA